MNIKKIVFTSLFTTISLLALSQNKGRFTLYISSLGNYTSCSAGVISCQLSKTDTTFSVSKNGELNEEWQIDSVPEGLYTLKIITTTNDFATFHQNINISKNKNNYYTFDLSVERKKMQHETTDNAGNTLDKSELTISSLFGNNEWDTNPVKTRNEMLSGNISMATYHAIAKVYSIGVNFGTQYARTNFYNDTSVLLGKKIQYKQYASASLNIGFINRFTFYNGKKNGANGLKLDIGINYNLPLFFKQLIKVDDDTKITTRHIHTYTDFNAMVRLGFKYIGLQADYSLTNFLRQNYIETPQLKVGIVFYIPVPVNRVMP